jgi:PKHD-type hydroxylase
MLLELDASVRKLTAANADRDALLQLTNLYHNLLRLWAEP